ncbi:MAG: hybrid sensor histidine kinase/response regulator [Planctomycetota bacterium]
MTAGGDLDGFSMRDLFRAEVESHASSLDQELVALESDPTDAGRLEALMRAAHSIKGAARIVNVEPAVRVAHAMEDCFVAAQEGRIVLESGAIDALLAGADRLRAIGALDAEEAPAYFEQEAEAIGEIVERIRRASAGEEAPEAEEGALAGAEGTDVTENEPEAPETEEATPSAAAPPSPPAPPARKIRRSDAQAVRVNAESLSRILAYAGESVVGARRLAAVSETLLPLQQQVRRLAELMERLDHRAASQAAVDASGSVQAQVLTIQRMVARRMEALRATARRSEDLAGRMYREVLESRMRPFSEGVVVFPRFVRDLSRQMGKQVRFRILGRKVPVDRDILEQLEAPLNHMIRNALDHGLETPAERRTAGKDEQGQLTLEAQHRAGMLEVRLRDDGRGVDPEALRTRVVDRELIPQEMATDLTESELLEFMFLPGFSTRSDVTEMSGRGVGLDVVHRMAREAGGRVHATNEPGKGMEFVLVMPITRSVIRAALVEIGGQPYAFPLTGVERLVRVEAHDISDVEGRQQFLYEGGAVGLVPAAQVLGLERAQASRDAVHVVLLSSGEHRYGLAVDRFRGEDDLVVRPLDPRLGEVPNISAAALNDEGEPVLIVDTQDLIRSVDLLLHEGRLRSIHVTARARGEERKRKRVLVVDDSITVREVERNLLQGRGYAVDVAVDGSEGWKAVRSGTYDLVITDVDMPRMDGIELVRRIRDDARLEGTPVIIVSYKDREEDRLRGLEAGANAYLTKSSFHDEDWIAGVVDLIGEPEA